ncbi:unnamed protein product [Arctogadus glacialis]
MWQWYSLHKCLNADPQAGSAQERKMAEEAFSSVRQWLGMKEEDISSKSLKRFRRFILDKEKQKAPTAAVPSSSLSGPVPSETVVPPSASVVPPSGTTATFEGQADTAMAPPPDPPQQPQTDPVPPSQEPPSGPRKRTSKSAALPQPQPIEATVTQPEKFLEWWWGEECPLQTLFLEAVSSFGGLWECGATAFAVPGQDAPGEKQPFCTAVGMETQ